ncbi:hypothetical protein KOR34_47210 [Posidoniimonas corsicana]|uniref:Uncharacterized protein n=1 Tax=Posidoniimonas corsicana TaxID=1938618 RepID=A0A5C5UX01_9BACT|nr:hypothetical protein KOR34_47210 [Posidoniimonas corsicana]
MFANWAAARLGLVMEFDGQAFTLRPVAADAEDEPPPQRSGLGSAFLSRRRAKDDPPPGESFANAAELAQQLLARLAALDPPPDLAPVDQPERVHDLAPALLAAYRVQDGGVHIAGCHFEDVPFVRGTTLVEDAAEPTFRHTLHDAAGDEVAAQLADALHLAHTRDLDYHPHAPAPRPAADDAPPTTAVVWAKRVVGHLQFTIGDATLKAPFEGWASTLEPPLVTCPKTGRQTRSLAAVELPGQGKTAIVAAEEIARCEESDRPLLSRDLVDCGATGRRVAPDLCEKCPVSGEWTLKSAFTTCNRCGQRVGRGSQQGGRCEGCRRMRRVRGGDPTLLAILAAHPTLAALGRWRLAETSKVYLLQGSRMLARYLLVLDRQDLSVLRSCRLQPLGGTTDLTPAEKLSLLAS